MVIYSCIMVWVEFNCWFHGIWVLIEWGLLIQLMISILFNVATYNGFTSLTKKWGRIKHSIWWWNVTANRCQLVVIISNSKWFPHKYCASFDYIHCFCIVSNEPFVFWYRIVMRLAVLLHRTHTGLIAMHARHSGMASSHFLCPRCLWYILCLRMSLILSGSAVLPQEALNFKTRSGRAPFTSSPGWLRGRVPWDEEHVWDGKFATKYCYTGWDMLAMGVNVLIGGRAGQPLILVPARKESKLPENVRTLAQFAPRPLSLHTQGWLIQQRHQLGALFERRFWTYTNCTWLVHICSLRYLIVWFLIDAICTTFIAIDMCCINHYISGMTQMIPRESWHVPL